MQFGVFLSLPCLVSWLSQTFSVAQGNGNSAPSRAADRLKEERMTEGVCEDGKGPAPLALSTGVNGFCRCRCPHPSTRRSLLTRSPAAAQPWGPGSAEEVLSLTSPTREQTEH